MYLTDALKRRKEHDFGEASCRTCLGKGTYYHQGNEHRCYVCYTNFLERHGLGFGIHTRNDEWVIFEFDHSYRTFYMYTVPYEALNTHKSLCLSSEDISKVSVKIAEFLETKSGL